MKEASTSSGFWSRLDRAWLGLASVNITLVIFAFLLLLSIPGTVILQYNISNVDPGIQYDYDFWKFGQVFQLFSSYHSFWYVGLIVILAMNLIACSVERWPAMWKMATAQPVAWAKETFARQPQELRHSWKSSRTKEAVLRDLLAHLRSSWAKPVVLEDGPNNFQVFWQAGRWSRTANYLVHISLLVVFAGAIFSSMYGFEGAANIPAGGAVDTFLLFKEGKASGLEPAPGGLRNERLLGFRIEAESFEVQFYEDWPSRPKAYISKINVIDAGKVQKSGMLRVNEPMKYKNMTIYQTSYGRMGDFDVQWRIIDKKQPVEKQSFSRAHLGEPKELGKEYGALSLVAMRAALNVQGLGAGVQFQEFKGNQPAGKPFWVLQNFPQFDFARREAAYGVVVDDVKELYYTGLQVASDPGAPVYWLGCAGMLIGTFYALFVTHRKYYLRYENGELVFVGTIHRLPFGFHAYVAKLAEKLKGITQGAKA